MAQTIKGPGGTYYEIAAFGPRGQVGVADLGDGRARVRVQASSFAVAKALGSVLPGWTQPEESNPRLSTVVPLGAAVDEAVHAARIAVGAEEVAAPPATLANCATQARSLAERLEALRG